MPDTGLQLHPLRPLGALRRLAALILAAALLAGCAAGPERTVTLPAGTPKRAAVVGVPLVKQQDFYCGPASLEMVMRWSGTEIRQAEIAAASFSPGAKGTYTGDMLGAARRRGFLAVTLSTLPEVLDEVAAGHPVIVFQNLGLNWAPKWHYSVVTGYDLNADRIVLHSGALTPETMPLRLFLRTWRRGGDWAMVVLPPDRLPAMADQWKILEAAAALERVGQFRAAETVYARGGARWPDNWLWPYGVGNARYQLGDLDGALLAYRKALAIDPSVPEVRHNLSELRKEMAGAG